MLLSRRVLQLSSSGSDFDRIYLLAASRAPSGDVPKVVFGINGAPAAGVDIRHITQYVGQWYDAGVRWIPETPLSGWECCDGESNAYARRVITPPVQTPYIKDTPVAWQSTHLFRRGATYRPPIVNGYYCAKNFLEGSDVLPYRYGYMFAYQFAAGSSRAVELTLPDNPNVLLFAVTLANNPNARTAAAGPLYD